MNATARAARFLRTLPEPTAIALCDAVRAAVARDPVSGPGIRAILPGMLWRLEAHDCQLSFSVIEGEPFIATARIVGTEPAQQRRPARQRKDATRC